MRGALWLLVLFAVAAAVALFAGNNQGTVTLFWPPYRVDLSLNLVLLLLVAAFLFLLAALRALAALGRGRRTIAVLGYMAELGAYEVEGHTEVGRLAAELGVDRLIAVADNAAPILSGAATVPSWTGEAIAVTD